MKIFSTKQIREIDRLTIEKEPISSIDLMERAADAIFRWFAKNICADKKVAIFAGPGNNGGDGLALARMLIECGYVVEVYLLDSNALSADCQINLSRLKNQGVVSPVTIKNEIDFPKDLNNVIIVDALFGSGLTRPLEGTSAKLVDFINKCNTKVISIDIPSGLFGEENPSQNTNPVAKASITLTLQFPKFSFFFAENDQYVGKWIVLSIGLNQEAINSLPALSQFVDLSLVSSIYKQRNKFSHKGSFGHSLIIAGSKGMMGAAVLASASCLKSGAGLVTAHVPQIGYSIIQQSIPEVMVELDDNVNCFSATDNLSKFSAIGIGPGIGKDKATLQGLYNLLKKCKNPLLIDADGLNIIAEHPEFFKMLPLNTIITPHPGEFDRLFGKSLSGYKRLDFAIKMAAVHRIVIVLKGAFTQVVCPDGQVFFNSTGNPGMATAGSGDVLTGIITSLLGQGYDLLDSSILGVYIHGLAGDIAAKEKGLNVITANDIINYLGDAFNLISHAKND